MVSFEVIYFIILTIVLIILKLFYMLIYLERPMWCNMKYTDQSYKCNTFVFAPILHELNSKI